MIRPSAFANWYSGKSGSYRLTDWEMGSYFLEDSMEGEEWNEMRLVKQRSLGKE